MRRTMSTAVAGAACLAIAAAGCGSSSSSSSSSGGSGGASAPGVTKSTITIGSHQPLTGPAAPGYSEISPASNAYFKYVNAHGGVNGRKIIYKYRDDGYNPTKTVSVVKELVLQDKVYGIFNGLGTPTHTKVTGFLNASRVPDLFVASGCRCWDNPSSEPYTFGWQTDYVREGKILGQYIKQHFAGKKVAYFFQNDDFGKDGVQGLDTQIPKSQVVSRQSYEPTNTNIGPQVAAIKGSGAQVVVAFTIPAFTALYELTAFKLGYQAQLAVSNVGSDPITLSGLLKAFSKGKAGSALIQGIITDGYLPPTGDTSNSWISLFKKIHDQYDKSAPFDGNVEYGMAVAYTFVQALKAAGKNPTRQSIVQAIENTGLKGGPGLTPFAYSKQSHAGYTGAQIGTIKGETIVLSGQPLTTDDGNGPLKPFTGTPSQAPANGVG